MEILKNSIKLTDEELQEIVWNEIPEKDKQIIEQGRWTTYYTAVHKIQGKYYELHWGLGSTEMQEHEICGGEFFEVVEIETKVKKFVSKDRIMKTKDNDLKMENLLQELKDFKAEKERLIDICNTKIAEYQEKIYNYNAEIGNKEATIKELLYSLLDVEKMKETKTEKNYRLPGGKLFIKKDKKEIKLKSDYNEFEIPEEFIKIKKSVSWADFKKILKIDGNNIINTETGEIVECCNIEIKTGGELNIKF